MRSVHYISCLLLAFYLKTVQLVDCAASLWLFVFHVQNYLDCWVTSTQIFAKALELDQHFGLFVYYFEHPEKYQELDEPCV